MKNLLKNKLFLIILSLTSLLTNKVFAYDYFYLPPPACCSIVNCNHDYAYTFYAESNLNSTNNGTTFDDVNYMCTSTSGPVAWNCSRNYLIKTYTSPDDQIKFIFNLGPMAATIDPIFHTHDFALWNSAGVLIERQIAKDDNISFHFSDAATSVSDIYTVACYNPYDDPYTTTPLFTSNIVLIPKIKKMWIESTHICLNDILSGTGWYNFQVKTDPAISSYMKNFDLGLFSSGSYDDHGFPTYCEDIISNFLTLNFASTSLSVYSSDLSLPWIPLNLSNANYNPTFDYFNYNLQYYDLLNVYNNYIGGLQPEFIAQKLNRFKS